MLLKPGKPCQAILTRNKQPDLQSTLNKWEKISSLTLFIAGFILKNKVAKGPFGAPSADINYATVTDNMTDIFAASVLVLFSTFLFLILSLIFMFEFLCLW